MVRKRHPMPCGRLHGENPGNLCPMGKTAESKLSTGDWITILTAFAGIAAVLIPADWIGRLLLVIFASGLAIYAARRHTGHPLLRALVAFIAITLLLYFTWHPIWGGFQKEHPSIEPLMILRKLDPSLITTVGVIGALVFVAIACAGLLLQRKARNSDNLNPPPIVATPSSPTLSVTTYTPQDVARLLEVLYEANQFMNDEPVKLQTRLHDFRTNWENQILNEGSTKYINKGNSLIRDFQSFYGRLNDFIFRKNPYYKEEVGVAMNMDAHPNDVVPAINYFVEGVSYLSEKPEGNTVVLLRDRYGRLDTSWVKFNEWIGGANTRIEFMTGNLRRSGVTGYEKK
jgi:hypothetical protein